jgi:ATP-binding cassette subfamily F protein 3
MLTGGIRNFIQFYSTKSERDRNLRKEYETQMEYRKHLQAFIDRWRYNANRGRLLPFLLLDF